MPFQYSFVPTDTACLPSAPLLFRRPPPGLHPPPGFRRPSGSGPGRTAHTHRNKQNLAACRRPTTRPHPSLSPSSEEPNFGTFAAAYLHSAVPSGDNPRRTCRVRRSLGVAGLGAGRWARLSLFSRLPSQEGLERAGVARPAGVGTGGRGLGPAGLRRPRCHRPLASGERLHADPLPVAVLPVARRSERAAAAPGCGRDSFSKGGRAPGSNRRASARGRASPGAHPPPAVAPCFSSAEGGEGARQTRWQS